MNKNTTKNRIIIQSLINKFKEYKEFAEKEEFDYEVIDFAYPKIINSKQKTKKTLIGYKKRLELGDIFLSMHGSFIDLYINSPDNLIKKASQKRIIQNLDIAKKLKIKYVIFHTNFLPMIKNENWVKEHVLFWKKIVNKYKIVILLENMWDKNPDKILEVIKKVNSKYLQFCFDIGHWNVFSDVSLEILFKNLGKYTNYIHINDNFGKEDLELPIGEGNISWKKFSKLVIRYCKTPYVVIEVKNLDWIKKSLKYMKLKKIYPYN